MSIMSNPLSVIMEIRSRIQQGWCQDVGAKDKYGQAIYPWDKRACKWCLLGAFNSIAISEKGKVIMPQKIIDKAHHAIVSRMKFPDGSFHKMVFFNDNICKTQGEMLSFLDGVIEAMQTEEQSV